MDPLAEHTYSWTPYRYCFDNPLRYIDPTGMQEDITKMKDPYEWMYDILKTNPDIKLIVTNDHGTTTLNEGKEDDEDKDELNPYKLSVAVSDMAGVVGNAVESSKLAFQYTGAKVGMLKSGTLKTYGNNFFGNQSTKIIKLSKPIKSGYIITSIQLSADFFAVISSTKGAQREAAEQRLLKDVIMSGIFAINAEAELLITVGEAIYKSPEVQQMIQQNQIDKERRQGILHPPSGPLFIGPGN